jgi:hypothetical protein
MLGYHSPDYCSGQENQQRIGIYVLNARDLSLIHG